MRRDPSVPVWPRQLAPQSISWGLTRPIITGPQPLSGAPQTVMSDMGRWRVTLSNILLHDSGNRVRLFRAILFGILAQGGAVYVPFYDWQRGPRARVGFALLPSTVPFSDASFFSDAASFEPNLPDMVVAVAASARAMSIVVGSGRDPFPVAGEFFGLGERAHMVTASFPDTPNAGQTTLQFQPPLRRAAAVGDLIETVDPRCRMQLDPKQVETLVMIGTRGLRGNVTLDFYESNWT